MYFRPFQMLSQLLRTSTIENPKASAWHRWFFSPSERSSASRKTTNYGFLFPLECHKEEWMTILYEVLLGDDFKNPSTWLITSTSRTYNSHQIPSHDPKVSKKPSLRCTASWQYCGSPARVLWPPQFFGQSSVWTAQGGAAFFENSGGTRLVDVPQRYRTFSTKNIVGENACIETIQFWWFKTRGWMWDSHLSTQILFGWLFVPS